MAGKLPYRNTDITTYNRTVRGIDITDKHCVSSSKWLTKDDPKTKLFDKGKSEERATMTEVSTVAIDAANP